MSSAKGQVMQGKTSSHTALSNEENPTSSHNVASALVSSKANLRCFKNINLWLNAHKQIENCMYKQFNFQSYT